MATSRLDINTPELISFKQCHPNINTIVLGLQETGAKPPPNHLVQNSEISGFSSVGSFESYVWELHCYDQKIPRHDWNENSKKEFLRIVETHWKIKQ